MADRELLVGFESSDDACVYRVNDEVAVIETVDFFTPITDDPYLFGQIAAANALSDVYAMGGEPKVAMNLLCVPECLPMETVRRILKGGHAKAVEAGCVIAGGHTIRDNEPKYGLCVTGFVHPDRILRNIGARPGDVLILTKPLGTGILMTGVKGGLTEPEDEQAALLCMAELNAAAGREIRDMADRIHACTDITGFGLLGHCYEMAAGSDVTFLLHAESFPLLSGAAELADMGVIPAGMYRNLDYVGGQLAVEPDVPRRLTDIAADPQTSGGLLVALPKECAGALLARLLPAAPRSAIIGEVLPPQDKRLRIEL